MASFDFNLRAAFAGSGALGAAVEMLRSCFGWNGFEPSSSEGLLAELQRPETQLLVEWHQDVLLSSPQPLAGDRRMIATENQSVWQAAQRTDGSVEVGVARSSGWTAWASIDLAELLCRMLAMEAVVGHGPSLSAAELPTGKIRSFELLPPLEFPQGPAELPAVVATDDWFGVTLGTREQRWIYAAPIETARQNLVPIAPRAEWHEIP